MRDRRKRAARNMASSEPLRAEQRVAELRGDVVAEGDTSDQQ
jgi:hypothetical protein